MCMVASCSLLLSERITSYAGWVAEAMILGFQCETCSTCSVCIVELHQGIVIFFTMRTFRIPERRHELRLRLPPDCDAQLVGGVNRCDLTKRKDPIHKWGLSTFGSFVIFVFLCRLSACVQLHFLSSKCTRLLIVSIYLPFVSVVCTTYARAAAAALNPKSVSIYIRTKDV